MNEEILKNNIADHLKEFTAEEMLKAYPEVVEYFGDLDGLDLTQAITEMIFDNWAEYPEIQQEPEPFPGWKIWE